MKLTPAQWRMLDDVCRTNGGGVAVGFSYGTRSWKVAQRLMDMGLVQGKAGQQYRAVHTKEGLELWRERNSIK